MILKSKIFLVFSLLFCITVTAQLKERDTLSLAYSSINSNSSFLHTINPSYCFESKSAFVVSSRIELNF